MTLRILLGCLLAICLASCDAWFSHQFVISHASSTIQSEPLVAATIREYAQQERIPCNSDKLPIQCSRQPIRIEAINEGEKIVICYSAMGIPLERSKFEKRIDRVESLLRERLKTDVSTVNVMFCPFEANENIPVSEP